jgi:hypothetical protein
VVAVEGLLHRVQAVRARHPFDGDDLGPVGLDGQDGAGLDRPAVHEHGAGAALTGVTSHVGPDEALIFTQVMDEQRPGLDFGPDRLPVQKV